MSEFKPNLYPIMYWGLFFGLVGGFGLFVIYLLSQFITIIWFPVFVAGLIWGGYRNYKKQRREAGAPIETESPVEEFKNAAQDIMSATKEMMNEGADAKIEEAGDMIEPDEVKIPPAPPGPPQTS